MTKRIIKTSEGIEIYRPRMFNRTDPDADSEYTDDTSEKDPHLLHRSYIIKTRKQKQEIVQIEEYYRYSHIGFYVVLLISILMILQAYQSNWESDLLEAAFVLFFGYLVLWGFLYTRLWTKTRTLLLKMDVYEEAEIPQQGTISLVLGIVFAVLGFVVAVGTIVALISN